MEHPGDLEESDNEEWEDIVEGADTTTPSTAPRPPRCDVDGNLFVAVVDVSGIHHLPVLHCGCPTADTRMDICYLEMGLFPASFERIQTVFTIKLLEDYRLSNLECKTSAYQYYQKLRRLTSPAFPKAVLNRYRELRRLSRQYRNIKLWKIHGRAHDQPEGTPRGLAAATNPLGGQDVPGINIDGESMDVDSNLPENEYTGKLASFCPACPQPGINLPDNWKDEPKRCVL